MAYKKGTATFVDGKAIKANGCFITPVLVDGKTITFKFTDAPDKFAKSIGIPSLERILANADVLRGLFKSVTADSILTSAAQSASSSLSQASAPTMGQGELTSAQVGEYLVSQLKFSGADALAFASDAKAIQMAREYYATQKQNPARSFDDVLAQSQKIASHSPAQASASHATKKDAKSIPATSAPTNENENKLFIAYNVYVKGEGEKRIVGRNPLNTFSQLVGKELVTSHNDKQGNPVRDNRNVIDRGANNSHELKDLYQKGFIYNVDNHSGKDVWGLASK